MAVLNLIVIMGFNLQERLFYSFVVKNKINFLSLRNCAMKLSSIRKSLLPVNLALIFAFLSITVVTSTNVKRRHLVCIFKSLLSQFAYIFKNNLTFRKLNINPKYIGKINYEILRKRYLNQ